MTQEQIERFEEMISDKTDQINLLSSKADKVENTYQKDKEVNLGVLFNREKQSVFLLINFFFLLQLRNEQLKQKQQELEKIQLYIQKLKESNSESLAKSQKSVELLQREYEELSVRCEQEKMEMNKAVVSTLDILASHKAYIQVRETEIEFVINCFLKKLFFSAKLGYLGGYLFEE